MEAGSRYRVRCLLLFIMITPLALPLYIPKTLSAEENERVAQSETIWRMETQRKVALGRFAGVDRQKPPGGGGRRTGGAGGYRRESGIMSSHHSGIPMAQVALPEATRRGIEHRRPASVTLCRSETVWQRRPENTCIPP